MLRYYIKFKYNYNPVTDSEYYKYSAEKLIGSLMMYNGHNAAKICISAKEEMCFDELKSVIKVIWENTFRRWTGSYNGFEYKNLKPSSFSVDIERVEDNHIIQTVLDVCKTSDKIVECFTECDITNIMCIYDDWKRQAENKIKTIADCL